VGVCLYLAFSGSLFFRNSFVLCETKVGGLITGKLTRALVWNKNMKNMIKILMLFVLSPALSFSQPVNFKTIDSIGNIHIGYGPFYSHEDDVIKKYGNGYFTNQEGHAGGRYYLDNKHNKTIHFEFGVDLVVDFAEVLSGNRIPDTISKNLKNYEIKSIQSETILNNKFQFEMSPNQIIKLIGKPTEDSTNKSNQYLYYRFTEDQMQSEGYYYEAKLHFINSKLKEIKVVSGEP
jgi:hypothetical protein